MNCSMQEAHAMALGCDLDSGQDVQTVLAVAPLSHLRVDSAVIAALLLAALVLHLMSRCAGEFVADRIRVADNTSTGSDPIESSPGSAGEAVKVQQFPLADPFQPFGRPETAVVRTSATWIASLFARVRSHSPLRSPLHRLRDSRGP